MQLVVPIFKLINYPFLPQLLCNPNEKKSETKTRQILTLRLKIANLEMYAASFVNLNAKPCTHTKLYIYHINWNSILIFDYWYYIS